MVRCHLEAFAELRGAGYVVTRRSSMWSVTSGSGPGRARKRAALIISRIKAGQEAAPLPIAVNTASGPTMDDLAARYLERACRCAREAQDGREYTAVLYCYRTQTTGAVFFAAMN